MMGQREPITENADMDEIESGLEWWATLSREDKARWLQCAATPDEIVADLRSPDHDIRAATAIASVGDAWIAFKATSRTAASLTKPLRYIVIPFSTATAYRRTCWVRPRPIRRRQRPVSQPKTRNC